MGIYGIHCPTKLATLQPASQQAVTIDLLRHFATMPSLVTHTYDYYRRK